MTVDRTKLFAEKFKTFRSFAGLLSIQPKPQEGELEPSGRIPFRLNKTQKFYDKNRTTRDIILKGRQVGVTSVELARDLWLFLTRNGAQVVIVVQSQDDMGPFKDICKKLAIFIDSLEKFGVDLEFTTRSAGEYGIKSRDATLRVIQAGASEAAASKKGRGGTVTRLHMTEVALYEQAEETFNSIRNSIPRFGSEVVIESTPKGVGGFYYDMWMSAVAGESAYKPHFFEWWLHDEYRATLDVGETFTVQSKTEEALLKYGCPPEAIKWRRIQILESHGKEEIVNQEYPNDPDSCFLLSGRSFFDQTAVNVGLSKCCEPIQIDAKGLLKVWEQPERGESYVIGADTSEGGGGDPSAALIYKRSNGHHVATIHGQLIPEEYAKLLAWCARKYNNALVAVERNLHGHAVILALQAIAQYRNLYRHMDEKIGWPTNEITRTPMLDQLDASHRRGTWFTKDRAVLGEMRTFTISSNGKPEGAQGTHDDLIMASAIGWAVMQRPQKRVAVQDE